MIFRRLPLPLLTTALLAASPASSLAEGARDAALGLGGEVYHARSGLCGELFESCAEGAEDHPVLALEVTRPGAPPERYLVPETAGSEIEGVPVVVFEDSSASLFLVWESRSQADESRLSLVLFDGEGFSEVAEISGDGTSLKSPPQLVITRSSYEIDGEEEETLTRRRTILHVAWWELDQGRGAAYYTPVVLEDGSYLGLNQVYDLTERDASPPPAEPGGASPEPLLAPRLEAGRDEHSVVLGFANPATRRFVTFEVKVLPGEVSDLAERIRSHMIEFGHEYRLESLPQFAERIRSHMIEFGHRIHPAARTYLAADLEILILASDPGAETVEELADRIRSHMIEFGARTLATNGLTAMPATAASEVLETRADPAKGGPSAIPHQLWLQQVSSRPAPAIGDLPLWVFLSEDGEDAVVSWEKDGDLLYRESTATGWSAVRRLSLGGSADPSRLEQMLRQRVRER